MVRSSIFENGQQPVPSLVYFNPLTIYLWFLGIEINPGRTASWSKSVLFIQSIGFLMIFLNFWGTIFFTTVTFSRLIHSNSFTTSQNWNLIIDFVSTDLLIVGSHGIFLIVTRQVKWKLLWQNLQKLEKYHGDFKQLLAKCQGAVFIAIGFILAYNFWNIGNVIWKITLSESARKRDLIIQLTDSIAILSEIYGFFGVVLFVLFGWITSVHFDHLETQIINFSSNSSTLQSPVNSTILVTLKKWRRIYVTLLELISDIQNCFGSLLLIWIVFVFINVISSSFYVITNMVSGDIETILMAGVYLLRNLIVLAVLVVTPVILRQQSQRIVNPLRRIEFEEQKLQQQLDIFTMEVMQSEIKITAMDFFSVDLTLFPKLVGTTLTYLIILCQSNK